MIAIYRAGIDEGNATFETSAPWAEVDAAKPSEHRFAAVDETGRVLGWVAATRASPRGAYAGVVEHSFHVRPDARGLGVASVCRRR